MPKGKDLGLNRSASSKSLPNGTEQRENDRKHSVCELSFLPCKFNWLNANAVFGRDCVKKVRKRHAVRKMKVGPSEPPCRRRPQTAISCFGPKGRGGERYG